MRCTVSRDPSLVGTDPAEQAILQSRLQSAGDDFSQRTGVLDLGIRITSKSKSEAVHDGSQNPGAETLNFRAEKPLYTWDRLCVPATTSESILDALSTVENESRLFDEWGLRAIQPCARQVINLCGPSGTGKTLAAHAIAERLGRPLLDVTLAELESRYLGDGPKNIVHLFAAAREQKAVLFIDEADSLLGRRMSATQGSERAANAMTSQLLIELERHEGAVVFATNSVASYDPAFVSRVLKVEMTLPDMETRMRIWKAHLPSELPLAADVDVEELARIDGVSGREIRNCVILAATRANRSKEIAVCQARLIEALAMCRAAG